MHTLWAPPLLPGLSSLTDKSGQTYGEFRKTLKVNYLRIQCEIVLSFLSLFVYLFISYKLDSLIPTLFVVGCLALTAHRILNVVHEGAHYLLSRSKLYNDVFCNIFAGWFVLTDVDQYRITHIEHHRNLGSEFDPENAHMEKLDLTWLVSLISGFNVLRRLKVRSSARERIGERASLKVKHFLIPCLGLFGHLVILFSIYQFMGLQSLIVWGFSIFCLAPALGILRNLLEHKYVEGVEPEIWYQIINREKPDRIVTTVTTRTFTKSILSQLYGSIGFTRHLLHHWDPSVSFSNLKKVHRFLLETSISGNLQKVDTTFSSTFFHLWRKSA
jgi:fatty acid desaturase